MAEGHRADASEQAGFLSPRLLLLAPPCPPHQGTGLHRGGATAAGEEDSGKGQASDPAQLTFHPHLSFPGVSAPTPRSGRGVTREVLHTEVSVTSSSEVSCHT